MTYVWKHTVLATETNCKSRQAYGDHKRSAKRKGNAFLLTPAEWEWLWLSSGHWHERGKRRGQYVMSRRGDQGAYEVGNVFFQPTEDNAAQGQINHCKEYRQEPCPNCGQKVAVNIAWRHRRKCAPK
ncbi:hypothetical protein WG922_07760 [Ramlibacter sp. AN1015]|uniref:hypothetical protein n=1 Tax=Ramlibacter sp. AN1015 TaxID=3133428 RepID=UPI0030BF3418